VAAVDVHLSDLPHEAVRHPEVVAAFAIGCLLLGGIGWWLAGKRGWSQLPAALAGCGLALALAVTLVRPLGEYPPGGFGPLGVLHQCVVGPLSLARTYEKLNVAMLMPYAFFGTLAVRRPVVVAASTLLISGAVEYLQGATGIGTCQARDLAHNTLGGVLGALLGAGVLLVLERRGAAGAVTAGRAADRESSR
jgi:hypothetical protein